MTLSCANVDDGMMVHPYASLLHYFMQFTATRSASLVVERLMRQGGLILAAGRVRSEKEKIGGGRKTRKVRRTRNTPRNSQQHGDRDQLETTCNETRPTR